MTTENSESLSYKFQRLRERLREAITKGELTGKLPGERSLAKQFQVNAKTLSKALTDLAAEGILDRSIGRGTYVKGTAPAAPSAERWLVLADNDTPEELLSSLRSKNAGLHVMTDAVDRMRPSFINQFSAVIDLASNTPESFLRDLVVRNISVVAVGREPKMYSMNAVMVDAQLGASRLARQLLLAGHRKFAVATDRGETGFVQAVQQTARHFDESSTVDAIYPTEASAAVKAGATAVLCDSSATARDVAANLAKAGASAEIMAAGISNGDSTVSGYYVSTDEIATAVASLLTPTQSTRPSVLWLAGTYANRGTTAMPVPIPTSSPAGAFNAIAAQTPQ